MAGANNRAGASRSSSTYGGAGRAGGIQRGPGGRMGKATGPGRTSRSNYRATQSVVRARRNAFR